MARQGGKGSNFSFSSINPIGPRWLSPSSLHPRALLLFGYSSAVLTALRRTPDKSHYPETTGAVGRAAYLAALKFSDLSRFREPAEGVSVPGNRRRRLPRIALARIRYSGGGARQVRGGLMPLLNFNDARMWHQANRAARRAYWLVMENVSPGIEYHVWHNLMIRAARINSRKRLSGALF